MSELKQTRGLTEAKDGPSKRDRVVAAAITVFFRYGYARTTLADIAQAAAISRPALYLLFPGKDDIFAAAIERFIRDKLDEFRGATARLQTLEERLRYCSEHWTGAGYDLLQIHPDAADIFNLAFPPVRAMYAQLESFFAGLVSDAVAKSRLKASPAEFARLLIFGMWGFKSIAEDGVHLRRLIALQVDMVVTALTPAREGVSLAASAGKRRNTRRSPRG